MIGLPSDIILASLWNIILAKEVNMKPGKVTFMLADTHIYSNHLEPALDYIKAYNNLKNPEVGYYDYMISYLAALHYFEPSLFTILNYDVDKVIKFNINV
jgi:thymidylate synthase